LPTATGASSRRAATRSACSSRTAPTTPTAITACILAACEGLLINRVVDLIAADRTYLGQSFAEEMHFVCPWHGYEYELATGECVGDRRLKLRKFDVVRGLPERFPKLKVMWFESGLTWAYSLMQRLDIPISWRRPSR
jgi:hypothetical protein